MDHDNNPARGHRQARITVNRTMFGPRAPRIRMDGTGNASSHLESLIVTLCHEMTHAIMMVACFSHNDIWDNGGHSFAFRKLNHVLWGHSEDIFTFFDVAHPLDRQIEV